MTSQTHQSEFVFGRQYLRRNAKPPLWEVIAVLIGVIVVLAVWQTLRVHERQHAQRWCRLAADTVQSDLLSDVRGKLLSDGGLTSVWQLSHEPTRDEWVAAADTYRRTHPSVLAVQWIDTNHTTIWSVNSDVIHVQAEAPHTFSGEPGRELLDAAASSRHAIISHAQGTTEETRVTSVILPVVVRDNLRGFTLFTYRTRDLLHELLQDVSTLGYSLSLLESGNEIYRWNESDAASANICIATAEIRLPSVTWTIRVSPTPTTVEALDSYLPSTFLFLGLLVCASVAVLLRLAGMARKEWQLAHLASETLSASQSRLAAILEISPEAIISLDRDHKVTLFNRGAEDIFGYQSCEIVGKSLNVLLPPDVRAAHAQHVQRFNTATEHLIRMEERRSVAGLRKDGSEFPAEASVSKIDVNGERIFTVCVRNIADRIEATEALKHAHEELEDRVARRTVELRAANQSLRELSSRVLLLQDQERRRIARELHDSTAQNLLLLGLNLSRLQSSANKPSGDDAEMLAQCADLSDVCLSEIRTISYLLHPPMLEEFGLGPALRWYVDGFSKRSGVGTTLDLPHDIGRLDAEAELTVFRVIQECLANVHRHSQSRTAQVILRRDAEALTVSISDQGQGIPAEALAEGGDRSVALGVGIPGMRERLGHLGGRLEIESSDQGTVITALIPMPNSHGANAIWTQASHGASRVSQD